MRVSRALRKGQLRLSFADIALSDQSCGHRFKSESRSVFRRKIANRLVLKMGFLSKNRHFTEQIQFF
jgi:hypothetical protein